jgi:phage tail sheath protein FI
MTALNNDRANTAFIIGDTPLDLVPDTIELTNWSNNVATTADIYTGIFYPAGLTNDLNGNEVVVPASHMALRALIRNDQIAYQWFAPAGARRGLIDNATAVGYLDYSSGIFTKIGVRQSLRDSLYTLRLNPIANLPGLGLAIFGQKTRSPIPQSTDRINVSRLINYIRSILGGISNSFLFEPNDKITRDQIKQVIEGAMNDLVAKRGVYDYLVVCDESNNTSDRIARNELYVDIAIEPVKAAEFIYIPIRLKNPGTLAGAGA